MAKIKILIVEDEYLVAKDLQYLLENWGYEASEVAASGEEAIEKAAEVCPDVVLMDIVLKGEIDGIEAADAIGKRFDIPIIYLTAYTDKNTLERAKLTKPFGYITKPYSEEELFSTIKLALRKKKIYQEIKSRDVARNKRAQKDS